MRVGFLIVLRLKIMLFQWKNPNEQYEEDIGKGEEEEKWVCNTRKSRTKEKVSQRRDGISQQHLKMEGG